MNISKEKIKTIVIILLFIIIIFGGSFFASELSYYKKNDCSVETNNKSQLFNEINISDYYSLLNGEKLSLIYIGRDDCQFSNAQDLVFEELLKEHKFMVNFLDLNKLANSEIGDLYSSYTSFEEDGISTPTMMLVKNKEVVMFKKGYTSKENLVLLLEENGFELN